MKPYIILILLVALAFANSIQNSFVWDDYVWIVNNPRIDLPLKEISSIFTVVMGRDTVSESQGVYYRPVLQAFFVIGYKIWGPSPVGFHLANIFMHLITVIFLYKVGLLLFESDADKELISLIAASIFAVHPVHNESVGRPVAGESLLGFFLILSLYFFLRERRFLSFLTFSLALLSKEFAVMFPFALAILAINKKGFKKGIVKIIPYMMLVGGYLLMRVLIIDAFFEYKVTQPIPTRIFTMAVATFDYIRLLLVPYPLSPYYPARWYSSVLEPKVLLAILVLISISILAFRHRKDRVMLFLLLSPIFILAPVILNVSSFQMWKNEFVYIAERYLYVPSMLFSLFVSAYVIKLIGDRKKNLVIFWILVIAIFSMITIYTTRIWKNDFTIFSKIVSESPDAVFAHNNLGFAYVNSGRLNEAIQEYLIALKMDPDDAMTHYNLGLAYSKQGRLDEAIREYLTVVRLEPDYPEVYNDLGIAYNRQGRLDEAIQEYLTAIKLKPYYGAVHNNLGLAYATKGRMDEAVKEYTIALGLSPNNVKILDNLGNIYLKIGLTDNAIAYYRTALALNTELAETHNNLGVAYRQKGLINEAIHEFQKALKLQPDLMQARKNLESLQR